MSKKPFPVNLIYLASDLRATLSLFGFVTILSIFAVILPNGGQIFHSIPFKIVLGLTAMNLISCLLIRITAGILGSFLLHLGVLILGIAAWISYTKDVTLSADVAPGDTLKLQESVYSLRLDSFVIEHTEKGHVKSYSSYVTVLKNGDSINSSIIRVNQPLKVDGWYLYQNSYGMLPDNFDSAVVSIKVPAYSIDTQIVAQNNQPVTISKLGHKFVIDRFLCSFMIDRSSNEVNNRTMEHDNPAFSYRITDLLGNEVNAGWSFPLYPDFHGMGQNDFTVTVEDYLPVSFSSFQIRRHTGDTVIMFAMILISIGLIAVFYFPRRKASDSGE